MDIQYIGEKSAILNWYITKNSTKAEKGHANAAYAELTSTKSLASRLWNVALCSLADQECGVLEVSDALLDIPLYVTDEGTVFKWVDVNSIRSRRIKIFVQLMNYLETQTTCFMHLGLIPIILIGQQN